MNLQSAKNTYETAQASVRQAQSGIAPLRLL